MSVAFSHYEAPTVWHGLAVEEALLDEALQECRLLLWRCPPAIVFGKHQVPQRECDLPWCLDNGLQVARRISGGGTVVHDAGSWSLALIMPRTAYRVEAVYDFFADIIRALGVPGAHRQGEGVWVGDHKVSGHAYCYRRQHVLHHGTLLLDSDLGRLRRALRAPELELRTHAVPSQPAPVVNLQQLGGDPARVPEAVREAAKAFGPVKGVSVVMPDEAAIEEVRHWNRVFGGTPRFHVGDGASRTWEVHRGAVVGEVDIPFTGEGFRKAGLKPPEAGLLFPDVASCTA